MSCITINCGCSGENGGGGVQVGTDSGWLDIIGTEISETSLVNPYDTNIDEKSAIKYRKKNGVVYIQGLLGIKGRAAETYPVLFNLPEGFRPRCATYILGTGFCMQSAYVSVRYYFKEDGRVGIAGLFGCDVDKELTGDIMWADLSISFPVEE